MQNYRAFLWKVAGGLGLVAALLMAIGAQTIRVSGQQEVSYELASRAHNVKKAINEVNVQLRILGTAQRVFITTNNSEYSEQFDKARTETFAALARLQGEIEDNLIQEGAFLWFSTLVTELAEIYTANVAFQRDGDFEGARRLVDSGRAVSHMESIMDATLAMEREEDQVLSGHIRKTHNHAKQTEILTLGGLGLSFLVILFAGLTIFRDLKRRLSIERALEDTLNFQRALVQSAGYGIIATDTHGIVTEFNKTAEDMLGYATDEVVGKRTIAAFHDPAELTARAARLSQKYAEEIEPGLETLARKPRTGRVEEREWTYLRKDGCRLPVQVSMTAMHGNNGRISGYLAIASDITERKKVERLKSEFISTVSHELRTPLTSIRGSIGLILGGVSGPLPKQATELLNMANKNSERLSRLINDILDVEKIESGKMEFRLQRQPLAPLLQQAVDSTKDFARQFNVSFALFNMAADTEVTVDADRFIQVIVNLLSNAAKFSPANGTVTVIAEPHGMMVRISVADKGKGIPAEFRDHIFEKFAQADSSDSRQKSGTGLGLSISKAIVEKMAGDIGFVTKEGVGTIFHVDLPDTTLAAKAANRTLGTGKRRRVLIVEDDADIAHLLRLMLDQGGFDSDVAYSAADAKLRLKAASYIAMTLDIDLPDQNGLDFFRDLRADPATHDLPVVVISAEADQGRRALNGAAVGIIDWLEKPIDGARLLGAVRLALRNSFGQRARVLHVEDDADLNRIVRDILAPVATVECASSVAEARSKIHIEAYDLVLLDMSLPDGDGAEILPLFEHRTPVVIFSAHDVPLNITRRVSSALIKSRTSNDMLLAKITEIIGRHSQPALVS